MSSRGARATESLRCRACAKAARSAAIAGLSGTRSLGDAEALLAESGRLLAGVDGAARLGLGRIDDSVEGVHGVHGGVGRAQASAASAASGSGEPGRAARAGGSRRGVSAAARSHRRDGGEPSSGGCGQGVTSSVLQ